MSTLFGVTINDIINSDLVIKQSNLKSIDVIFLTILAYIFIVFAFPFNGSGETISGYGVLFKGFDGDLVFSLRLSFFGYLSLLVVTLLTVTNVFKKSRITLFLIFFLVLVTVINNGIAVSQALVSVESISLLVGGSILLLIVNGFELLRSLFVSRNNINSFNSERFTLYIVVVMLVLYIAASLYFVLGNNDYQGGIAWWGYVAVGSVGLSIIIFVTSLLAKKRNLISELLTLSVPMVGIFATYLIYMIWIDDHVYIDDLVITLLIEVILSIPLLLVIYKRKY